MNKKKRLEVDIGERLSERTEQWADLLGIDLEDHEFTPLVNQHMNEYIVNRLEELKKEKNEKKETSDRKAGEEHEDNN